MDLPRDAAMDDFLARAGWSGAIRTALPGDASTRRYLRVRLGDRAAMLMDQPQSAETPNAPPGASAAQRQALGYNAVARLAGADCGRFLAVAEFLRARGLSAPQIYAADLAQGFVLLEDLGDQLYADAITQGADAHTLYASAVEVLVRLHLEPAPAELANATPLFAYDAVALLAETDLLVQWFLPLALGRSAQDDEIAEHRALWQAVLAPLQDRPQVLVHRDYHAQNLLWLPTRSGLARTGIIDFQDAVAGLRSYDLVSLIEDARRDVAGELAEAMTAHYLDQMRAQGQPLDAAAHRAEMAVMAGQRNAKIAGIFARLCVRDGKPRYLDYLPRVWRYLDHDLAHPVLAPLRTWYDQHIPQETRSLRRAVMT